MDRVIGLARRLTNHLPSRQRAPPEVVEDSPATVLISGDGGLNEKGLEDFMKLHECGVSYAVVAIMGPQSGAEKSPSLPIESSRRRRLNHAAAVATAGRSIQ